MEIQSHHLGPKLKQIWPGDAVESFGDVELDEKHGALDTVEVVCHPSGEHEVVLDAAAFDERRLGRANKFVNPPCETHRKHLHEQLSSLTKGVLVHSRYGHIVLEIKDLLGSREFFPQKISRLQNRVADRLAKYSRSERATAVWLGSAPPCIEDIWPLDCNSIHM